MARKEMRAAYPSGPPAYYLVDEKGETLDQEPMVFCSEECRGEWVTSNNKPGFRQCRSWAFISGKPPCDQCKRLI